MREEHKYYSHLEYGSIKYNLGELTEGIERFLEEESKVLGEGNNKHCQRIFYHTRGISVQLTKNRFPESMRDHCGEYHIVDIDMYSEVTPTASLEKRVDKIVQKSKKKTDNKNGQRNKTQRNKIIGGLRMRT